MADGLSFGNGQDTISSKSAKIFIQKNGQNKEFAQCTSFKATIKKNKEKVKTIGSMATKNKLVGIEMTGSLGGYVTDSELIKSELQALKGGQEQRFNIVAKYYGNNAQGTQTILLKSVSLDDVPLGDIKSDDGLMEFESDFTFDDFDLVEAFK